MALSNIPKRGNEFDAFLFDIWAQCCVASKDLFTIIQGVMEEWHLVETVLEIDV